MLMTKRERLNALAGMLYCAANGLAQKDAEDLFDDNDIEIMQKQIETHCRFALSRIGKSENQNDDFNVDELDIEKIDEKMNEGGE